MHFQWKFRLPPGVQDAQRCFRSRTLIDLRLHVHLCLEIGDPWRDSGGSLRPIERFEAASASGIEPFVGPQAEVAVLQHQRLG